MANYIFIEINIVVCFCCGYFKGLSTTSYVRCPKISLPNNLKVERNRMLVGKLLLKKFTFSSTIDKKTAMQTHKSLFDKMRYKIAS